MEYKTVRLNDRILHIPDSALMAVLKQKTSDLRRTWQTSRSPISVFGRNDGLKKILPSHRKGRFFVVIDFVYAFHQITREKSAEVIRQLADPAFDICFVKMGDKEVLPQGSPTSNYIFEIFMASAVDRPLIRWVFWNGAVVTRYCDNILVTLPKNDELTFAELVNILAPFKVRFTPRKPKKWRNDEPIRFCGLILFKGGKVGISRQRKRQLLEKARQVSVLSLKRES